VSDGPKPSPGDHPDLDLLGTAADGERVPRPVTTHLARCPECQEVVAALVRVRAELAALPPLRMPAEVADRLTATLREAAHPERSGAAAAGAARTRPARPRGAADARPRRGRAGGQRNWLPLAAAASLAGLIAAGALALNLGGAEPQVDAGRTAAGAAAEAASPAPQVHASGIDYRRRDLARQVADLVAGRFRGSRSADAAEGGPDRLPVATTAAPGTGDGLLIRLEGNGCLRGLVGSAESRVLVVDAARFQGAAALIVVVAGAPAGLVDVYVVGPGCSAGDHQVRYFARARVG
jgi:hypothetical protein